MVSPGAGPTVAVAAAPEPVPLNDTRTGPVQPLTPKLAGGPVMVTPVTVYGPPSAPTGLVLTTAVGATAQPLMLTVGTVVQLPPAVTLTKTTRLSDGVAIWVRVTAGVAVTMMLAVAVRGVVPKLSTTWTLLVFVVGPAA